MPNDHNALFLNWSNLHYVAHYRPRLRKERKVLMHDVSGAIKSGEVMAIMSYPTASGSALLNILAGRLPPTQGQMLLNGQSLPKHWRRMNGFVEKDPAMYRTLTVQETVDFAAQTYPVSDHKQCVEDLLETFELHPVEDVWIGDNNHRGVSNGERRRTAIASTLVHKPQILFLEEPTWGLDAFTSYYIIETLRDKIARNTGTPVMMTINRPRANILDLFDKILLISMERTVFFGTPEECMAHFATLGYECPELENPADYILDLITIDDDECSQGRIDRIIAAWSTRTETFPDEQSSAGIAIAQAREINPFKEYWILLVRALKVQFRDYPALASLIVQTLAIALLLAFIFFQMKHDFNGVLNRIGLLFFIPINVTFNMVMPIISSFSIDRAILRRERISASSYNLSAFYMSEFLAILPVRIALYIVYSFIIYYISGLRTDSFSYFLVFLALVLMLLLAAVCLGMAVGAAMPSVEIGQIVGPLLIVIFLIFGGNLADANVVTWILRWIQYISLIFYCFQGLVQNELNGQVFAGVTGKTYLREFSLNLIPWYFDVLALFGLALVFLFIGFLALHVSTRPKIKIV